MKRGKSFAIVLYTPAKNPFNEHVLIIVKQFQKNKNYWLHFCFKKTC